MTRNTPIAKVIKILLSILPFLLYTSVTALEFKHKLSVLRIIHEPAANLGSDFDKLKYFVRLIEEDIKSEEFFNLSKSDPDPHQSTLAQEAIEPRSELWYNHSGMKADPKDKGKKTKLGLKKDRKAVWKNWDIDVLLWVSIITLGIGLFAPILTFKKLLFFKSTVSIFSVLTGLFQEKEFILFLVIFIFSVVFPIVKNLLIALTRYMQPKATQGMDKYLLYLSQISKWSMLDVFLVALLVVIVRLGVLGKVEARWGIYIFAASVFLSTSAVNRLLKKRDPL
ncbi:paraquat-inducible protein A [Acidobacteriota bacterium]